MQILIDGVRRFHEHVFPERRELFERLGSGQHPQALFITCSDSRIDPCLLTQTDPGDLFVLRNAGNIVPRYDSPHGGEAGAIEFAILGLSIQHIIVCGHSKCGAMGGLLNPQKVESLPALQACLVHAEAAKEAVQSVYDLATTDNATLIKCAVEQNVLVQLQNLQTHPVVADALSRNELTLHGWVYDFETGVVTCCGPDGEFAVLGDATPGGNQA